tara:strand:- start:271 stop:507 length:237 start_codon:yes stop_codon:yes gene_type:complete
MLQRQWSPLLEVDITHPSVIPFVVKDANAQHLVKHGGVVTVLRVVTDLKVAKIYTAAGTALMIGAAHMIDTGTIAGDT